MTTSEWVQVGSTLFLGFCALMVPRIAEYVKRRAYAPKLILSYRHDCPFAIETSWRSTDEPTEPVYFFCFNLVNDGRSQASRCEVVLNELWIHDTMDIPRQLRNFSPVNLRFDELRTRTLDLNPKRRLFWNLCHVSSPEYQQTKEKNQFIDLPGLADSPLRLVFDQIDIPFGQPNCLPPGKYTVGILVTSENAKPLEACFQIAWSGNWKPALSDMLREIVIAQSSRPDMKN
jgi:hypothetical protein